MPKAKIAKPIVVSNGKKGTTIHLGDGRKLAFGESAEVSAELAAILKSV